LADLAEGYNAANVGSSKVGFFDLWCSWVLLMTWSCLICTF
jgi:hypothetical protein